MLDPTGLVALNMSQRLMTEQFSEQQLNFEPPRWGPKEPVRARVARSLRTLADALEPSPRHRTS